MSHTRLPVVAEDFARGLGRAAGEMTMFPVSVLLALFRRESSERRAELSETIWEVRRLLRMALAGGLDEDLTKTLNFLARHDEEIQRAFVVWFDLIEVLVQHAEQKYGPTPGLGRVKAAEVKGIARYLMRNRRFDIPDVPRFIEPIIIDLFVDWSIDIIVLIANHYGLWVESQPSQTRRAIFARVWLRVRQALGSVGLIVLAVYGRIREAFRRPFVVPADVQAALDAVMREGLIVDQGQCFRGVADLLIWVSTRRRSLLALLEVVFAAVQQAETYLSLSGPEKRAYARDLVLAVLDELGFKQRAGLLFAIIDSTINSTIEGSVHLFHKRGLFSHRPSV
ncbi:MAG TPA: hypothetical protein VJ866_04110 [Pyrinomonadaceae bacterium]|nr:hypothetical protein [Pyrinomonadaceae bacterium]